MNLSLRTICFIAVFLLVFMSNSTLALHDPDFYISSYLEPPISEHVIWCLDMNIYSECVQFDIAIPKYKQSVSIPDFGDLDKFCNNLDTYLVPNGIVPYQTLGLVEAGQDGVIDKADIDEFFETSTENMILWMTQFTSRVKQIYNNEGIEDPPVKRFRLMNEANTWGYINAENYYYLLSRFFPYFKNYMPMGSQLVISLACAENAGTPSDYRGYLRTMLLQHPDPTGDSELPFDGMDIHGYNMDYRHYIQMVSEIRAVFHEVFGYELGQRYFSNLLFWGLETASIHHGCAETVWSSCIFEYNSDWDLARYAIKAITNDLNLPNMQFMHLVARNKSFWASRAGDNVFCLGGLLDNGALIFDKGKGTKVYGYEPLKRFTKYLVDYDPDTPRDVIFSTDNIRRYQFKKGDDCYRLIVWKDYGNEPEDEVEIKVPPGWRHVYVMDLISGKIEEVEVELNCRLYIPVFDNPLLLTPSLTTGSQDSSGIVTDIRSGIEDLNYWGSGTWSSILTMTNPSNESVSGIIKAYLPNGSQVGSTVEFELPGHGVLRENLLTLFPPFRGSLEILTTQPLKSSIEHRFVNSFGTHAAVRNLANMTKDEIDPDTFVYLTSDWEIGHAETGVDLFNQLALTNPMNESLDVTINTYDDAGALIETDSVMLGTRQQYLKTFDPSELASDFGKVELLSGCGLVGQMSRFMAPLEAGNYPWTEETLFSDKDMVDEISLVDSSIPNADRYSRIIVTNPWETGVTGILLEFNSEGNLTKSTPVSIPAHETYVLALESGSTARISFKLNGDVKVFGREETVVTESPGGEGSGTTTSKSVKSPVELPNRLILPYLICDPDPDYGTSTVLRIQNDNNFMITARVSLFTMQGEPVMIESGNIEVDAMAIRKINILDLFPQGTGIAEGNLELRIPETGGVTTDVEYKCYDPVMEETFSFPAQLILCN